MTAEDRPAISHDVHTAELPPLPQRDYLIPATRWVEAPDELRALGADFGVHGARAHHRRVVGMALQPFGRGGHVVIGGQGEGVHGTKHATARARPAYTETADCMRNSRARTWPVRRQERAAAWPRL